MTMLVRPAHCEYDTQKIIETLQANLPHLPHAQFFSWLYLQNPEGRASVWVASDPSTNGTIGIAAAFPRRVYCGGKELRSYVLGDFCIRPSYRALGAAMKLQRTCLEGLSSESNFVYDLPSQSMLTVYKRMRIEANTAMVRYAKPLRADRKLAERIPIRTIASSFSFVVNAGLQLRDRGAKRTSRCAVEAEHGPWGEEFTAATREWSPHTGICVVRTADYLNWRYRAYPTQSYEMLTARQDGRLCGYLVQHMNGQDCSIDDLLAEDDEVRSTLLAQATAIARRRRAYTISVQWLSTHPGHRLLEECGFHPRESSPVVIMTLVDGRQAAPASTLGWYLTLGDWER